VSASDLEMHTTWNDRALPELLARTLRHEVGDFLQKVYATVAILQKRLPAEARQEQDVLQRLRVRAESCKHLLDAFQDFLCPLTLACEPVDVAHLAGQLAAGARKDHPQLEIGVEAAGPAVVQADPCRAAQVGNILLANACEAAQRRVTFCTTADPASREVAWTITDDGPGVAPELAERLFSPFFTTRAGHAGLGLVLARKVVLLHGGRTSADNVPGGGFQARVVWPCPGGEASKARSG
jgi:signal transduction histidine kinase